MAHTQITHPPKCCRRCTEEFVPRRKNVIYCSNRCAVNKRPPPDKPCRACGMIFSPRRGNAKYCSPDCIVKKGYRAPKRAYKGKLSTGTTGAITELKVAAKLMEDGWCVFRSLSPNSPIDLVAIKGVLVRRLEVRTGVKNKNGTSTWSSRLNEGAGKDAEFAVYFPANDEIEFHKKV